MAQAHTTWPRPWPKDSLVQFRVVDTMHRKPHHQQQRAAAQHTRPARPRAAPWGSLRPRRAVATGPNRWSKRKRQRRRPLLRHEGPPWPRPQCERPHARWGREVLYADPGLRNHQFDPSPKPYTMASVHGCGGGRQQEKGQSHASCRSSLGSMRHGWAAALLARSAIAPQPVRSTREHQAHRHQRVASEAATNHRNLQPSPGRRRSLLREAVTPSSEAPPGALHV